MNSRRFPSFGQMHIFSRDCFKRYKSPENNCDQINFPAETLQNYFQYFSLKLNIRLIFLEEAKKNISYQTRGAVKKTNILSGYVLEVEVLIFSVYSERIYFTDMCIMHVYI